MKKILLSVLYLSTLVCLVGVAWKFCGPIKHTKEIVNVVYRGYRTSFEVHRVRVNEFTGAFWMFGIYVIPFLAFAGISLIGLSDIGASKKENEG